MSLAIGSLFTGIGGFDLGLERAGLGRVAWQCDNDPWCREVLAKHWPGVPCFDDVRKVGRDAPSVSLLCGGFPCQDVSSAGRGAGLAGERSGLWFEFRRIVEELAPEAVIVENVASGASRWLPFVRGDLEALGYGSRAFALSAEEVGAPHLRRRIFVVAADPHRVYRRVEQQRMPWGRDHVRDAWEAVARDDREPSALADSDREGEPRGAGRRAKGGARARDDGRGAGDVSEWWAAEPAVGRVAHGVPRRLDRLGGLGNAIVPQQAEVIGRLVLELLS